MLWQKLRTRHCRMTSSKYSVTIETVVFLKSQNEQIILCRSKELELTIRTSDWPYKDMVGIHREHRFNPQRGEIYKIEGNGRVKFVVVRGNDVRGDICMDLVLREHFFGISADEVVGKNRKFKIAKPWQPWGGLCFAWHHSDLAYRVSVRLGVI